MYDITVQTNNLYKSPSPYSNIYLSKKYLWLKDPFVNSNKKHPKEEAAGLILATASLLMMSKGIQKNAKKVLLVLKKYTDKKYQKTFFDDSKSKKNFYNFTGRKIDSFIHKSESLNNIISLKDILFMKLMYETKPTKWIHSSISKLFEKISRHTVSKSYRKTQKEFDKMYNIFDKFDEYLLKHPLKDKTYAYKGKQLTFEGMIKEAKSCRESVRLVVNSFIARPTQQIRYESIKDSTSSLYSRFWNESFKGFWTKENKFKRKEMWQTFIAAEQVKRNKTELATQVAFARNMLSYTPQAKSRYISGYLDNIDTLIPQEDIEGANILKRLEWYIQDNSALTSNKENFLYELNKLEKHQPAESLDVRMNESQLKDKKTNIRMIRTMINDDGTGELDDMLNIYRCLAPFELSKSGALDIARKSVESFDRSVHLETGELYDKLRDLDIGSAPTDVLTLVFSAWMIVSALDKAKNHEEKKSILLKSGIPIVGGVATTLISATKLLSSGKSIMLGFVSGLILNRMGIIADDIRKEMNSDKKS